MNEVQVGKLTITPNMKNPLLDVHPAIDIVDNTACVGVWLPCQIKDDKGNIEHKNMLFLVTDKQEMILASNNHFREIGKHWRLSCKPIEMKNRWALDHVEAYLKGATVEPLEVYKKVYSIWKKYMDFPNELDYVYQTLWSIATYFFNLFNTFPYNYFGGITGAGKTKSQDVEQHMAFNAIHSNNMSPATIFRLIQNGRCTLLLDETEALSTKGKVSERTYEIRTLLLSGYKKGAVAYRCDKNKKDRMVPTPYETYSPKSLANIRGLEDVIGNRCKSTIIKKSTNLDIVNREVDSTKEDWSEFIKSHKGHLRDHLFPLVNVRSIQSPIVNYSKMHTSDLIGLVIKKGNDVISVACFYRNLLGHLTINGLKVSFVRFCTEQRPVNGVYMAAYAN